MMPVKRIQRWSCVTLVTALALAGGAGAQTPADPTPTPPPVKPAPKSSAQQDAGEPRADTSPTAATQTPTPAPAAGPVARASGPPPPGRPAGKGTTDRAAADRVDLGTATVTGDREQPKVMYIVPWKRSDIGDLSGKPMNSLLDDALAPVDRDEFRREVAYYDAVKSDASQHSAPPQAEK